MFQWLKWNIFLGWEYSDQICIHFSVTDSSQHFPFQRRKIQIYLKKPIVELISFSPTNFGIKSVQQPSFKMQNPTQGVASFFLFVCFLVLLSVIWVLQNSLINYLFWCLGWFAKHLEKPAATGSSAFLFLCCKSCCLRTTPLPHMLLPNLP